LSLAFLGTARADAQTLAQRVADAGDGTLHVQFAAPAACGDGGDVIGRRTARGGVALFAANLSGVRGDAGAACRPGPVHVELRMAEGRVVSVRATAGPAAQHALAVSSAEAASLLLETAMHGGGGTARAALVPVLLLDGEAVWRGLLRVARSARAEEARSLAAKELGRRAAATVPGGDHGNRADTELSKKNGGEAEWLAIATRDPDPALRRAALQLLGKEGTPRALDLFESILSGAR
jgi:hypothetical protein